MERKQHLALLAGWVSPSHLMQDWATQNNNLDMHLHFDFDFLYINNEIFLKLY